MILKLQTELNSGQSSALLRTSSPTDVLGCSLLLNRDSHIKPDIWKCDVLLITFLKLTSLSAMASIGLQRKQVNDPLCFTAHIMGY